MSNFASASAALTAALAVVDARIINTDDNTPLELYIELIDRRARIQDAIGGEGGASTQIPAFTNSPTSFGAVNQAVLKASAGAVYKIYCYNKNAAIRFLQIHNKATAPVNTDVPLESFPINANSALILDSTFWGATGRVCSTGVSWAFSSTEATLTLGLAADQTSSVGYL